MTNPFLLPCIEGHQSLQTLTQFFHCSLKSKLFYSPTLIYNVFACRRGFHIIAKQVLVHKFYILYESQQLSFVTNVRRFINLKRPRQKQFSVRKFDFSKSDDISSILRKIVSFDKGTFFTCSAALVAIIVSTTIVTAGAVTDSASVCAFLPSTERPYNLQ